MAQRLQTRPPDAARDIGAFIVAQGSTYRKNKNKEEAEKEPPKGLEAAGGHEGAGEGGHTPGAGRAPDGPPPSPRAGSRALPTAGRSSGGAAPLGVGDPIKGTTWGQGQGSHSLARSLT